ncbi:MAG: Gfo/Idh/MocA family oxidoreductase, partial [Planctomycetes bacterium]|nr:Gfo/Idh/MocA family oxidoreductase [Planctomycetota bacterium]
ALNALKLPHAVLTSLADPSAASFSELEKDVQGKASKEGIETLNRATRFEKAGDLLGSGKADAVILCLPTHLHEKTAIHAFKEGLHVLCEKPIALTPDAADAMIAAADAAERCFMIAHCLRFWPEYLYLRNCHLKGPFGQLLSLNLWRSSGMPEWSAGGWILDRKKSGGPLIDQHIHDVDIVLSMFGRPDRLSATAQASRTSKDLDIIHTQYSYEAGPQVHLHGGWSCAPVPFSAGYEAWFEKGFVRYSSNGTPTLEVYQTKKIGPRNVTIPPWDAYEEELRYFLGCILNDRKPELCLPSDSRTALLLALKAREAALEGTILTRGDLA